MRKTLFWFALPLGAFALTLIRHEPRARALTNLGSTTCNHFSADYDPLLCFFADGDGTPDDPNGGGGGVERDVCPGGTSPRCVQCNMGDGTDEACVTSCLGGYTCRISENPANRSRTCETGSSCRSL
jgi:hypothetical protein